MFIGLYCMERAVDVEGTTNGLYLAGSVVYAGVVIIANMKILTSLNNFHIWAELLIFGSIFTYFFVLFIMS